MRCATALLVAFHVVLCSVCGSPVQAQNPPHGWAGTTLVDLTPQQLDAIARSIGRRVGVMIVGIAPGSPAEKAGLREGCVIIGVGGTDVTSAKQLADALAGHTGKVEVLVARPDQDGHFAKATVSVDIPTGTGEASPSGELRLRLKKLSDKVPMRLAAGGFDILTAKVMSSDFLSGRTIYRVRGRDLLGVFHPEIDAKTTVYVEELRDQETFYDDQHVTLMRYVGGELLRSLSFIVVSARYLEKELGIARTDLLMAIGLGADGAPDLGAVKAYASEQCGEKNQGDIDAMVYDVMKQVTVDPKRIDRVMLSAHSGNLLLTNANLELTALYDSKLEVLAVCDASRHGTILYRQGKPYLVLIHGDPARPQGTILKATPPQ